MMDKQFMRLYLLVKITDLENKAGKVDGYEEALKLQGRLELLKEMFDELNLEEVKSTQPVTV